MEDSDYMLELLRRSSKEITDLTAARMMLPRRLHMNRLLEETTHPSEEGSKNEQKLVITTVIAVIILLLILLTIAFEEGKHKILHAADKNTKPIIASLFGELTVLGFLSLFTFCVTQLGAFERLSIQIFGHEEKEELLEIFESVHYMLFGVMVFFVASVLVLVQGAKDMEQEWFLMDMVCRHSHRIRGIADKLHAAQRLLFAKKVSSWRSYLYQSLSTSESSKFYVNLGLFCGIRNEFLLERSLKPPFEPTENNGLDMDFNFGRYLSISLGHTLSHVVELEHKTWYFLGLLTILYYILLVLTGSNVRIFAWEWVATGWTLFLFRNFFDYHLLNVLYDMASPLSFSHHQDGSTDEEKMPLFPSDSRLPKWAQIEVDEQTSHDLASTQQLARQDLLYWNGRNGPESYKVVFQIQLIFTSAYISLLILKFYPYIISETSIVETILFFILSLLPFGMLLLTLRRSAANLTMVCNIGVHRKPQTIAKVLREAKTDHVIRSMVLMQKLQYAATNASEYFTKTPKTSASCFSDEVELLNARKIFDAMDKAKDEKIDVTELSSLMERLGAPTTADSFQAIVQLLDVNKDGVITEDEFLSFYQQHILPMDHSNLHKNFDKLAHQIFSQFVKDDSHEITLSEFKAVLESFNVDFTIDEMGDVVNEIDSDNSGSIGVHEFTDLLENHRHLFQRHILPPLPLEDWNE